MSCRRELAALLVTAAHQVEYSRGAAEAQVHLAVDASRVIGEGRASGVVNAVLRRFVAQRAELLAAADAELAQRHAHPRWLVDALRAAWGERSEEILAANNQHPPMVLQARPRAAARRRFPALLARARPRGARASSGTPTRWCSSGRSPVQTLPGFEAGAVSVQDGGAQLAAPLLDAQAGMRVLDACAAPGGKTLHIAQRTPDARRAHRRRRRSAATRRACAKTCERAGRDADAGRPPTCATVPPSLSAGVLRPRAGGRALFGHRRHPPPSRHQAAAPAERHRSASPRPSGRFSPPLSNY